MTRKNLQLEHQSRESERKRQIHIVCEKKRRANINSAINEVYKELPEYLKKKKMTKAEILDAAHQYLTYMMTIEQ